MRIAWLVFLGCRGPDAASRSILEGPPSEHAPGDWRTEVGLRIANEEYRFQRQEGRWHASNRAHDLRAHLDRDGAVVRSRTGPSDWSVRIQASSIGRPGRMRRLEAAEPRLGACDSAAGAGATADCLRRLEYRRDGLVEWWRNGVEGLEQGFDVPGPPAGRGPLVVEVALGGELGGRLDDGAVLLGPEGSERLAYSKLTALDANGSALEASMEWNGQRVRIVVRDGDAAYPLRIDPLLTTPSWTAESNQVDAVFGTSVSAAGDVNGDGFDDVVVGAGYYDNGEADEGRAFVYEGSATGLGAVAAWTAESDQADARFGDSVSTAGDVNGDGFDDVIVGALYYWDAEPGEGAAFVYHGSASGLGATPAWTEDSDLVGVFFGDSVSAAGDVNGDGFDDVIVGAPYFDNPQSQEGRAFVYHGSAAGLGAAPSWTAESDQATAHFGFSVSAAGDVNGDGFDDVVVGAWQYDGGDVDEGRAYVYHGSAAGLGEAAAWTAESDQADAVFGWSVSTAGDVNGDGFDDVIVGEPYYDSGLINEGRAFVYQGSAGGLGGAATWTAESGQAYAFLGNSVSTAGDVNGDGFGDVIVGAWQFDDGEADEGRAFVYHGSAAGLHAASDWIAEADQAGVLFGNSVSTAGDVNGDGFDDVIVGAGGYEDGEAYEGRALLYLGSCDADGAACSGGLCRDGACETDDCFVAGSWYDADAPDPDNHCQACVPTADPTGWTALSDGTPCDDGNADTTDEACSGGLCGGSGGDSDADSDADTDKPSDSSGGCGCRMPSDRRTGWILPSLTAFFVAARKRR